MKYLVHAATIATALAASAVLMACGGSDEDNEAPTDRLALGSALLKLNAQPYEDHMPTVVDMPGTSAGCQGLIVPVWVEAVEGTVPAGISVRAIRLRQGNEDVWRATVADSDRGAARGTARACSNAKTTPGTAVRVIAELDTPAGARQMYTDTTVVRVE